MPNKGFLVSLPIKDLISKGTTFNVNILYSEIERNMNKVCNVAVYSVQNPKKEVSEGLVPF